MSEELKPCPFCGGKARFRTIQSISGNTYRGFAFEIICEDCKIAFPKRYEVNLDMDGNGEVNFIKDERVKAISDWNRRANDGKID